MEENLSSLERMLYKNSCNISEMIHILTIHENNVATFMRQQNANDTSIVNLLNNVLTNMNDLSGNRITRNVNESQNNLLLINHTVNPLYLNELKYIDLSYNIYSSCPISREIFLEDSSVIQIKKCGHYFKKESMLPWLRQSTRCPYCRANIIGDDNDHSVSYTDTSHS